MKKFLLTVFAVILGLSAVSAQTSDIQDTFFGVSFGTSQDAAESILMRKDIYAISDYNQLEFYNVALGGYEWSAVTMEFNDYGLYEKCICSIILIHVKAHCQCLMDYFRP